MQRSSGLWVLMFVIAPACDPLPDAALEVGAEVLQDTPPVDNIAIYVHGFHVGSCEPELQEPAYHFCNQVDDDLHMCAIYDGAEPDALYMGTEHIISRQAFDALPSEEKVYWHPHNYEVKSGLLTAPGLPEAAEHELMERLVTTYGKTWHVWHTMEDDLPEGPATLMKAFTADGQIRDELLREKEEELGISIERKRMSRADIPDPGYDPGVLETPVRVDVRCEVAAVDSPWREGASAAVETDG